MMQIQRIFVSALLTSALAFGGSAAVAASASLDAQQARTLLVRAGFDPRESEVAAIVGLSQREAAMRLVRAASAAPTSPMPAFVNEPIVTPKQRRDMTEDQRREYRAKDVQRVNELRAWWIQQMLATPTPLAERMTLFWHNHFATQSDKVSSAWWMAQQHQLLRANALGSFRTMLSAIAKSPAMLVYLDGANNRKQAPNENFAREVMELFTLGEGQYSEADIKQAARAFTGWSIEPETAQFVFRPGMHDAGEKTVFGVTGNFDGDAMLEVLLRRPQAASFLVTELWREFVSPVPDERTVERIAAKFRQSNYEIGVAMTELLSLPEVIAPTNRGTLVKSPVELVIGTARRFEVAVADTAPLAFATAALGQNLFNPPNVKGWPGGELWINASSLLARKQFVSRMLSVEPVRMMERGDITTSTRRMVRAQLNYGNQPMQQTTVSWDADNWLVKFGVPAQRTLRDGERQKVVSAVLAVAPVSEPDSSLEGGSLVRALALDPAYQVK
ncbi:MAG: DUF1800 domain-containing protein [Burkholderiaceae bacterium]